MRRRLLPLLAALIAASALCLCGCAHVSSYRALGLVRTGTHTGFNVSFSSLTGTLSYPVRNPYGQAQLRCGAALESGQVTVWLDAGGSGERTELFTLRAGEETERVFAIGGAETLYVILETDGTCGNGSFRFTVEKQPELTDPGVAARTDFR